MFGGRREPSGQSAHADAIAMLARRDYSAAQLHSKLRQRGHADAEIESALERLRGDGHLDDGRVAGSIIRRRSGSGWGPQRVQAELGAQGVSADIGRAQLDEADIDWECVASDALRSRLRGGAPPSDHEARQKLLAWMVRRGFPLGVARKAMATLDAEADGEDGGDPSG